MEIDSRNIVIQEEQKQMSFDNVVSISDLESASRHKPRDWDCTLRDAWSAWEADVSRNRHPIALFLN